MEFLVSDTSVLIDLERGNLLEATFKLPFDFAVPDLLYAQELHEFGGPEWIGMGLRIEELSGEEVSAAAEFMQQHRRLSVPDCFALVLALKREWALLTGDKELRTIAEARDVSCHGVLWVLDRICENKILSGQELRVCLQAIVDHLGCRLPARAVRNRLRLYAEADE